LTPVRREITGIAATALDRRDLSVYRLGPRRSFVVVPM
jgi:hypothetical protein